MMPAQKTQTVLIGSACVATVLVTFVVGYWLMRDDGSVAASSAGGGDVATAPAVAGANDIPRGGEPKVTAPVPAPAIAAPAPANPTPVPAAVELVDWNPVRHGCDVELTGAKIHIVGTNDTDGWGKENGVTGSTDYPVQDFEVSTDFMVPKFKGPGAATVILQARESNFSQVTLQYYLQGNSYMLRWWTNSGEAYAKTQLRKFGDEATAYHRMRLKYEAATHKATGWVDGNLVGTLDFEFKSNVRFVMGASTDKKGTDIDLYFDHTTLSLGGNTAVPVPPEMAP
jgi:hypothetical protein